MTVATPASDWPSRLRCKLEADNMDPANTPAKKNDRARVDHIPSEPELEDMVTEMDAEDIKIENRKPDLGEADEDPSEL
jgi:hypothetical protein